MIAEPILNAISTCFENFLEKNNSGVDPENKLIFDEITWNKPVEETKAKDCMQIFKTDKILFIDYMYFMAHFPNMKYENIDIQQAFDEIMNSQDSYELVKFLKQVLNNSHFLESLDQEKNEEWEIRFYNIRTLHRFTQINSRFKNKLITLRGEVFYRWDEIRQFVTQREWSCMECGTKVTQMLQRGEKLAKLKRQCRNTIGEGESAFICRSTRFVLIGDKKYEDLFRIKIEALPQDTPNKLEVPNFTLEFTHNLCNETFLNSVITGTAFEFTGFIKLQESKTKTGETIFKPYLEVMSFRQIEKRAKKLEIFPAERKEIIEFLKDPKAIDKLVETFGSRVVGFDREKKFWIITKTLQECFNRFKELKKPQDYLNHLLLVGDFSIGKSALAEVFEDICDNSYYVIGSSASKVGLTGITERDEMTGHFSIQAGVLARASGSSIILEEFDKQENKAEFGILNESMSKYEYVITKAGKQRRFKCYTTQVIIANPIEKKFDLSKSIVPQIDIAGDLLSRFTVLAVIYDKGDIEMEKEINLRMLERTEKELLQVDNINALYIKKCMKIASEIDPNVNVPQVLEFIDNFTNEAVVMRSRLVEQDQKFWENYGNRRNRQSLIKLIKGVAMLHLHKIPTKADMVEALELFQEFNRDIITMPELLNPDEIAVGRTLVELEEKIDGKLATQDWETKTEEKKTSKKGRRELLLEKLKVIQEKEAQGMVDVMALQHIAKTELNIDNMEFDELIEVMQREGMIYSRKPGFVSII